MTMWKGYARAAVGAVAITVVLCLFSWLWVFGSDSPYLSYNSIDYQAQVLSNGDLKVRERLDYRLRSRTDDDGDTKPWRQLYWQYTLDSAKLTGISDVSVTDVTDGVTYRQTNPVDASDSERQAIWDDEYANTWYIADGTAENPYATTYRYDNDGMGGSDSGASKTVELGWNIPTTVERDSLVFDVEMTLHGVSTAYDDVSTFQWEPISTKNEVPARKVTGTVSFPEGADGNTTWTWLHTDNGASAVSHASDGSLRFTLDNLKSNEYVNVVAASDVSLTPSVQRKSSGAYLGTLKDRETKLERKARGSKRIHAILMVLSWLLAIAGGVLLCAETIRRLLRAENQARCHGDVIYWRDKLPVDVSEAAWLNEVLERDSKKSDSAGNVLAALALVLAKKGMIAIYPGPHGFYDGVDLLHMDAAELSRIIGSDRKTLKKASTTSTLVILPKAFDAKALADAGLHDPEAKLLDLLIAVSERVGSRVFDLRQMRKACTNWKHGTELLQDCETARKAGIERLGVTQDGFSLYGVSAVLTVVLGVCVWLFNAWQGYAVAGYCIAIPLLLVGLFVLMAGPRQVLTDKGREYAGKCLGLKRYMLDFSDFRDRDASDLALWDWYLIYATAFGISDRLAREMAKAYPQLEDRQWLDEHGSGTLWYWTYALGSGNSFSDTSSVSAGGWSSGFSAFSGFSDFGSQISSGFSDISSTISSAGSDGSGGFDGGDGGSGGGSSGGR